MRKTILLLVLILLATSVFGAYGPGDITSSSSPSSPSNPSTSYGGGGGGSSSYTATDPCETTTITISVGKTVEIKECDKLKFDVDAAEVSLYIKALTSSVMTVNLSELPLLTLISGNEEKFDLDSDGSYDLLLKYRSYDSAAKKGKLFVQEINEKIEKKESSSGSVESTSVEETELPKPTLYNEKGAADDEEDAVISEEKEPEVKGSKTSTTQWLFILAVLVIVAIYLYRQLKAKK